MFYLMTHSTHFIYGYMVSNIWLRTILIVRKEGRKEGNVLFNDALNTFPMTANYTQNKNTDNIRNTVKIRNIVNITNTVQIKIQIK